MPLFKLTITDPPRPRERKLRTFVFIVDATSEAAVVPTFADTHEQYLVANAKVEIEPHDYAVIRL